MKSRCQWAVEHPELLQYHDEVWGRPEHDDRLIFAALGQCIMHAGLLWTALLRKRADFAAAFDDWDIAKVAAYDDTDFARLIEDSRIIRNFNKVNAIIHDAQMIQAVQAERGSFGAYLWAFVGDTPLDCECVPGVFTCNVGRDEAEQMSRDMKRRGFKFAGPATCYGLMEDIGMVNDHDQSCFRYKELISNSR